MKNFAWGCAALVAALGVGGGYAAGGMATGAYVCLLHGEVPEPELNFTVTGPGAYTGADHKPGTYSMAGNVVTFDSGALAGVEPEWIEAVYVVADDGPALNYRDTSHNEDEGTYCQHVK